MVSLNDINALTLVAKGYMLELAQNMIDEQKKGCTDCADKISWQIQQLILLVEQLYAQIDIEDYGDETSRLYDCLLSAVANYSGASISVDTNSSTPNTNIYVTIVSDGRPDWKDIDWSQMTNDVNGYRDTFFSPDLVGLNPDIQREGTVMYRVGIEYDNDGLGTIKFKEGFGFYSGQYFRMGNYQQYTAPTPSYPPAGTYRLINNSTIDTSYYISSSIPLVVGQTVNSPISLGESLLGLIQIGQKLNFTRYLSNGTIDLHLELVNPPATQLSTGIIDLNKSYEFIYTDGEIPDNIWHDFKIWDDGKIWTD